MSNYTRMFLTIEDIQKEYLPISKRRIRSFVKKFLPVKIMGRRIYTNRHDLEKLLQNPDRDILRY